MVIFSNFENQSFFLVVERFHFDIFNHISQQVSTISFKPRIVQLDVGKMNV